MSDQNPYEYQAVAETKPESVESVPREEASRARRLGAVLLDAAFCLAALIPSIIGIAIVAFAGASGAGLGGYVGGFIAIGIGLLAYLAFMIVQIIFLVTRSQTIGKRLLGIAIFSAEDGERAGAGRSFGLRLIVNSIIGSVPYMILIIPLTFLAPAAAPFAAAAAYLYPLVDILFIFRKDRRCIHDLLAGTKVAMVRAGDYR